MKFKEIDDVKGYMHTMFKGEALVFRGCLYVWNGEDLVWQNGMPSIQASLLKNDLLQFSIMLNDPRNRPRILKIKKALWKLFLSVS